MKISALILGIIGGIGGLAISIIIIVNGYLGIGLGASGAAVRAGVGWAALILSLAGIRGGTLTISRPTTAGILMLIGGIGGFVALTVNDWLHFWRPPSHRRRGASTNRGSEVIGIVFCCFVFVGLQPLVSEYTFAPIVYAF